MVKYIVVGAEGHGFDSQTGQSNRTHCCQRPDTSAAFLCSCVAQALSLGDGLAPRYMGVDAGYIGVLPRVQ